MTTLKTWMAFAALATLGACANVPDVNPDYAAKNRPLEERCVRAQLNAQKPPSKINRTRSEIQAEARIAASRGELDKACDWL